jgi:DNA-binding transcriptional ArsR family regulator
MATRTGQARSGGPAPAHLESAAATFDMLSTPIRLHLMWLLCHGDHDVGSLAEQVGATVAAVSQHLAKLRLAGLVSARREGRHQIYTADDPHILVLVEQVFAHVARDGSLIPDTGGEARRVRRWPRFDAELPRG